MLTKTDFVDQLLMQGGMDIADLLKLNGDILMPLPGSVRRTSESSDVLDIISDETLAIATETEVISTESIYNEYDQSIVEDCLPSLESTYKLVETPLHPLTIDINTNDVEIPKEEPLSADALSTTSAGSELTPLIKEELKYTIKARRCAEGKSDINIEFKEPGPEILTHEESEKREDRRLKNKMAAQKCRTKKRLRAEALELETEKLQDKQDELRIKIEKLQDERDQLIEVIKIHRSVCPQL